MIFILPLLQMLNVVFQRMEADSVAVAIKPIAVADVLGLARGPGQDGGSMANAVQVRPDGSSRLAGHQTRHAAQQEARCAVVGLQGQDSAAGSASHWATALMHGGI